MLERPSEILSGYWGLAATIIDAWRRPDFSDVALTMFYLVSLSLPFLALFAIWRASRWRSQESNGHKPNKIR